MRHRMLRITRWRALVLLAVVTLACAHPSFAQGDFPSRPVTLIVPWPAGGPTDLALRALADAAAKHLGQPIIIDNKAGASGTLGPATMAATAKPDGYTIAQLPIPVFRMPLMQKTTWDPRKDFTYIVHLTGYVFATLAKGDGPFKTWADVVAYAKANPGRVTYATPGSATTLHVGMEQMADHAGIKLTQVPFKGATEALAALLGGHVMLAASGASNRAVIDDGQIRVLAMWTKERTRAWPKLPTLREVGLPFDFESPFGLAGPKGMDPAVVEKLHQAFRKALAEPHVVEAFERFDMVTRYLGPADYRRYVDQVIAEETAALGRLGLLKKD